MRYAWFVLVLLLCTACTVEFKSRQLDLLKASFERKQSTTQGIQWTLFFEGKQHLGYAVYGKDKVKFLSLGYLEVDFSASYVSSIRLLSPKKFEYTIKPTKDGAVIQELGQAEPIIVSCSQMSQLSEFIYIQQCQAGDIGWVFSNELEVNQKREVVYIKSYYSPSKPPIEMYHSPLFEQLKNKVD